jgi:hypothetical protein
MVDLPPFVDGGIGALMDPSGIYHQAAQFNFHNTEFNIFQNSVFEGEFMMPSPKREDMNEYYSSICSLKTDEKETSHMGTLSIHER